jgi:Arc/MetJ-type ribon-helix-helix transcriptional regulator
MPKKVLIALPPAMLEQVDYIAIGECRTRSDLIRESLRRYIQAYKQSGNVIPAQPSLVLDGYSDRADSTIGD